MPSLQGSKDFETPRAMHQSTVVWADAAFRKEEGKAGWEGGQLAPHTRRRTLEWNQTFTGVHIVWTVDEERGKEPPSQPLLCQPFLAYCVLTMVFKATGTVSRSNTKIICTQANLSLMNPEVAKALQVHWIFFL